MDALHAWAWMQLPGLAAALELPPLGPRGLEQFVPYLERMRAEGAVVVLKLDGERTGPEARPYTALVSGGRLGDDDFKRTDAASAEDALAFVVAGYFGSR